MTGEKVRLAFVGLGNWGNRLARAAERCGAAEVVRCFARTGETRRAFAEDFNCAPAGSLEEMLRDDSVEGVVVSTPHSTHAEIIHQATGAGWHNDPAEWPLGGMTGRGVHMIDNFHYLAGPVKRVIAFSKKLLGATRLDDITSIGLEFESGPLGYIGVSQVIPLSIRTAAFGTEAAAWSEEDGARLFFQKKGEETRSEIPVESGDALAEQLSEFARCIREGAAPETGGAEGLEVVAAMEAIIESAKSGRVAEVADFRA